MHFGQGKKGRGEDFRLINGMQYARYSCGTQTLVLFEMYSLMLGKAV